MKPHPILRSSEITQPLTGNPQIRSLKRITVIAVAVLLLPLSQTALFAQQTPYYPGSQQPYSSSPQYDPGQQYAQPLAPPAPDDGQPEPGYGQPEPGYSQPQSLSPDQLEQLVAPIALNPDSLVALMLAASTYPAQVEDADHWLQAQGNLSPDQIAYGASFQAWDPSVKALTAFPQVLAEMDGNIQWTAALGNAYYNQPQDVLQAIQVMRQRAQSAGNLQSTPEENVNYNQGYIQLAPVNPQVVYVPAYNPWAVYGQPVTPYPGFSLLGAIGSFFSSGFGSSAVQFGLGTVLSAFNHTPFGLIAWGLDWLGQNLLFNHSSYYSHSASVSDWGLRYGGPRAWMAPHRSLAAYNRGYGQSYNRGYSQNFRSQNRYAGSYNRGYPSSLYNYNRNPQSYIRRAYRPGIDNRSVSTFASRPNSNYNRSFASGNRSVMPARPLQYSRSNYATRYQQGFASRQQSSFANRSMYGSNYNFNRNGFSQRSDYRGNAYTGSAFRDSGRSSHFGGFGHEPSFKAP